MSLIGSVIFASVPGFRNHLAHMLRYAGICAHNRGPALG